MDVELDDAAPALELRSVGFAYDPGDRVESSPPYRELAAHQLLLASDDSAPATAARQTQAVATAGG